MMMMKVKLIFRGAWKFDGLTWLTPTLFILWQMYATAN